MLNLAIFGGLLIGASRFRLRSGTLWWAFLTVYPVARFLVEMTRVNPQVALGLTQAQFISVPLFITGVAGLGYTLLRRALAVRTGDADPAAVEGADKP